jgi:hypothetical protein
MSAWTPECERLLADWSEKASCFRWLHARSEKKYRQRYYAFAIPVIILSTLTGFANVGLSEFVPGDKAPLASAIIGGVNLLAGILGTLQSFLKVAETMEAHRSSGVAWSKLGRNISIELSLDPVRRSLATDFLAASRSEYDRLTEQSPAIPDGVISVFRSRFDGYDCSKPSICNGLDRCAVYKTRTDATLPPSSDDESEPELAGP